MTQTAEARARLWRMGIVAPWYLRPSQLDIYSLLLRDKFPFVEAARRFGKTNSILAFVVEKLIQNPGWVCRWCFPDKNTVREVMSAEIPKLQRECPNDFKFVYQTIDSVWKHPNGSGIYIRGVNHDKGDSARGPGANIIVADEYGFWSDPEYIIREALFPQLENQAGQWLIKTSTPPKDIGHRYFIEKEDAIRKNRFIQKIIYDNEALSKEELDIIIEESGGIDSNAFKRERLCQMVRDPKLLVVPEFDESLNVVDDDYPRPEYFTPYVSGDSGFDDNAAMLFAYHDFIRDEIVFDYERVANGQTTRKIVRDAKRIEKALWRNLPVKKRTYDAQKQSLFDIYVDHKYPVTLPLKSDKHAAVQVFRVSVGQRKIKVKKRCKQLIRQLTVGMWRDERHSDFQRSEGLGHLDAVAAAIYLNRSVDLKHNPWPLNPGVSKYTHFIPPESSNSQDQTEKALRSVFGKARLR